MEVAGNAAACRFPTRNACPAESSSGMATPSGPRWKKNGEFSSFSVGQTFAIHLLTFGPDDGDVSRQREASSSLFIRRLPGIR